MPRPCEKWHPELEEWCPICRKYRSSAQYRVAMGDPAYPMPQTAAMKRKKYSLPCLNEGAILEWCNTCNGEMKHVRECDVHEKCTRGYVSLLVQACTRCTSYVPDNSSIRAHYKNKPIEESPMAETPQPEKSQTAINPLTRSARKQKLMDLRREAVNKKSIIIPRSSIPPFPEKIGRTISPLKERVMLRWEYGVTCMPQRFTTTLPTTLLSLQEGGFDSPRLFVDDITEKNKEVLALLDCFPVTYRTPIIKTFGNWYLALIEMYIRHPQADRYAIFQDDIVMSRNVLEYLEHCAFPERGYLNLITYPQNEPLKAAHFPSLPEEKRVGWYPSNQRGQGAQGLVFSRDGVVTLMQNIGMVERPQDPVRGWRNIDGGIVNSMKRAGWKEYVHSPSLIRHTGIETTMGNHAQPLDVSFRGEEFDALSLLPPELRDV